MRTVESWRIVVIALAIAMIGFLFIHRYNPQAGIIWNLIHAEIELARDCPPAEVPPWELYQPQDGSHSARDCSIRFPYRWVLAGAIAIAVSLLWGRPNAKTKSATDTDPNSAGTTLFWAAALLIATLLVADYWSGRLHGPSAGLERLGIALGIAALPYAGTAVIAAIVWVATKKQSVALWTWSCLLLIAMAVLSVGAHQTLSNP